MVIDLLNHRVARKITDHDVERFTEGDCHILAETLSELTGYPMYAFGFRHSNGKLEADCHVFLKVKGRFVDVNGPQEPAKFIDEWDPSTLYEGKVIKVTRERLDSDGWDRRPAFVGSIRRAREVAAYLINNHQEVFA